MRLRRRRALLRVAAAAAGCALACTNNPYPDEDADDKVYYTSFVEAPRTLDPAVSYTTNEHALTGNVFATLLEYHYLKRPYALIPGLALAVPEAEPRPGGRVAYRFELRPGALYQDDDCFARGGEGRRTREILAEDVAFELMRIADPAVNSPVIEPFSHLVGFRAFSERLAKLREGDAAFAGLPAREQYARAGGIEGVRTPGPHTLEIELSQPYPQILFWFAMAFTAPVPWEAVEHWDGQGGRDHLADHPVGSGPYRLSHYDKQARMVLEANPNWFGARHPEWRAPAAVYPEQGEPGDREVGLLEPAGRPLPFIQRIEFRREKEPIPRFNKFLQGYYDASGIVQESFDKVIVEDRLSPAMAELGVELERSVDPSVFYLGFNMDDATVGAPGGARARRLRQAMSLAIDVEEWTRLFSNGRGVPAQSPVPPGLYGYEPEYRNPWRVVDLERARRTLAEAGYRDGVDPKTGRPLRLTFDTYQTSAQGLTQIQFFVDAWRKLGIDVEVSATTYNQFQEKVRNGAYQVFMWGWVADYPDPENFFFLLWSEMARSKGGPNTANFSNPRFDALYVAMKSRENDAERARMIREMIAIVEQERPWIELFHAEDYALYHGWLRHVKPFGMSFPMTKYQDLDPGRRAELRARWNEPVLWPAFALAGLALALVVPAVVTFRRERQ
jgi:ABC-type transport system substrate-binding protein